MALETLKVNKGDIESTVKEMKCSTKNIQDWLKQKDKINEACNKYSKKRLIGARRKLFSSDLDAQANKLNHFNQL